MSAEASNSTQDALDRLRAGDAAARDALMARAAARLERLARAMLRGQYGRVGRWSDADDVVQGALLRLWTALGRVEPESPLHFNRLAAAAVRRELIDLARHYYGPQGLGANYASTPDGPSDLGPINAAADDTPPPRQAERAELHEQVWKLPPDEAAVTDLLYYQGLTQEEAAGLLGVDVRTVQRRWQRARRALGELFTGE